MSASLGDRRALLMARLSHAGSVLCLLIAGRVEQLGTLWSVGIFATALLLFYEHWLVRRGELQNIDKAFFQVNSWVGITLFVFVLGEIYLH
jgi:4-hydroxybenzoate polyprenyltransferase